MSKVKKTRKDIKKVRKQLDRLDERISGYIHELEAIEVKIASKKEKDPKTEERRQKIQSDLRLLRQERRSLKIDEDKARTRKQNRKKLLKKLVRKLKRLLAKPKIIDLNLDFNSNMSMQGQVNKVIGHYTAGPEDQDDEDAIRLCKNYHQAHKNKGWAGEGYGLCFTREGSILLLRPLDRVGAHTYGENTGSYGIMVHGTIGDTPTRAQKKAIKWWAKNGHTSAFPSDFRAQKKPGNYDWYGHNDFNPTGCPGSFKKMYVTKGKKS